MRDFRNATGDVAFRRHCCAVCAEGVAADRSTRVPLDPACAQAGSAPARCLSDAPAVLPNAALLRPHSLDPSAPASRTLHAGLYLDPNGVAAASDAMAHDQVVVCEDCMAGLRGNRVPALALRNWLDVGVWPAHLQRLTLAEEMLIARKRVRASILTLRSFSDAATAHHAIRGNVISFDQRVDMLAETVLPRAARSLVDVINITFLGSSKLLPELHRRLARNDFVRVRRAVVQQALEWLVANNPRWRGTRIDRDALQRLPVDGVCDELWAAKHVLEDPAAADAHEQAMNDLLDRGTVVATSDDPCEDLGDGISELYPEARDVTAGGVPRATTPAPAAASLGPQYDVSLPPSINVDTTDSAIIERGGVVTILDQNLSEEERLRLAASAFLRGDHSNDHTIPWTSQHVLGVPTGATPVGEYSADLLYDAFPALFPYGRGAAPWDKAERASLPERCSAVSFERWVQHLLRLYDRRFAQHPSFVFVVFNICQRREVCRNVKFRVRKEDFAAVRRATAAAMQALRDTFPSDVGSVPAAGRAAADAPPAPRGAAAPSSAPAPRAAPTVGSEPRQSLYDHPTLGPLLRKVSLCGRRVMGSPASRKHCCNEMRGLAMRYGPAALFLTINLTDNNDPRIVLLAGRREVNVDGRLPTVLLDGFQRARAAANDPVAVAEWFAIIIRAVLSTMFGVSRAGGGVLGPVSAYYGTLETQGRGSLHAHFVVHLEGVSTQEIQRRVGSDAEFRERLFAFLESVIAEKKPSALRRSHLDAHDASEPVGDGVAVPQAAAPVDTDGRSVTCACTAACTTDDAAPASPEGDGESALASMEAESACASVNAGGDTAESGSSSARSRASDQAASRAGATMSAASRAGTTDAGDAGAVHCSGDDVCNDVPVAAQAHETRGRADDAPCADGASSDLRHGPECDLCAQPGIHVACYRCPDPDLPTAEFLRRAHWDLEHIVQTVQKHKYLPTHNPTCYKGAPGKGGQRRCRMRYPRPLRPATGLDPITGRVFLARDDPYLVAYNRALSLALRCNTDITFLGSGRDAMAIQEYVTDYITKCALSTYKMLDLFQSAIAKCEAEFAADPSGELARQASLLVRRCLNKLNGDLEMSGPLVATYMLGLPDHYTSHDFQPIYVSQFVSRRIRGASAPAPSPDNHVCDDAPEGGRAVGDDGVALEKHEGDGEGVPPVSPPRASLACCADGADADPDEGEGADAPLDGVGESPSTPADDDCGEEPWYDVALEDADADTKQVTFSNAYIDYAHRGTAFEKLSVVEFMETTYKARLTKKAARQHSAARDAARFLPQHPQYNTRYSALRAPRVVYFLGEAFPRRANPDVEERYGEFVLTFFKPWRDRQPDLIGDNTSWSEACRTWLSGSTVPDFVRRYLDNLESQRSGVDLRQQLLAERARGELDPAPDAGDLLADPASAEPVSSRVRVGGHVADGDADGGDQDAVAAALEAEVAATCVEDALDDDDPFVSGAVRALHACRRVDVSRPPTRGAAVVRGVHFAGSAGVRMSGTRLLASWMANLDAQRAAAIAAISASAPTPGTEADAGTPPSACVGAAGATRTDVPDVVIATLDDAASADMTAHRAAAAPPADVRPTPDETIRRFTLNQRQAFAFRIIIDVFERERRGERVPPLRGAVLGEAGVGKSAVLRAAVDHMCRHACASWVRVGTFTGKAATIIDGRTLHSLLGMSGKGDDGARTVASKSLHTLQQQWQPVRFLLVDEISMVSCKLLAKVSAKLREARASDGAEAFGGIHVVAFGDFRQFEPVCKATSLFRGAVDERTGAFRRARAARSSELRERTVSDAEGRRLWREFTTVVELVQPMRCKDMRFHELQHRVRMRTVTQADYALLLSRVLSPYSTWAYDAAGNLLEKWIRAPYMVARNRVRGRINNLLTADWAQREHERPIVWHAQDTWTPRRGDPPRPLTRAWRQHVEHLSDADTDGKCTAFTYLHDAPFVYTANTHTELGLANGARGRAHGLMVSDDEPPDSGTGAAWTLMHPPLCVLFRPDKPKHAPLPGLDAAVVPVRIGDGTFDINFPVREAAATNTRGRRQQRQRRFVRVRRSQLTLVPAFASTDIKAQGATYHGGAVADIARPLDRAGGTHASVYVQITRVPTLNDLAFLRPFSFADLTRPVHPDLVADEQRLAGLMAETLRRYTHLWQLCGGAATDTMAPAPPAAFASAPSGASNGADDADHAIVPSPAPHVPFGNFRLPADACVSADGADNAPQIDTATYACDVLARIRALFPEAVMTSVDEHNSRNPATWPSVPRADGMRLRAAVVAVLDESQVHGLCTAFVRLLRRRCLSEQLRPCAGDAVVQASAPADDVDHGRHVLRGALQSLVPVETPPDGACLYRAVGIAALGSALYAPWLKLAALSALAYDDNHVFVPDHHTNHFRYAKALWRACSWGDSGWSRSDHLLALSAQCGVPIVVVSDDEVVKHSAQLCAPRQNLAALVATSLRDTRAWLRAGGAAFRRYVYAQQQLFACDAAAASTATLAVARTSPVATRPLAIMHKRGVHFYALLPRDRSVPALLGLLRTHNWEPADSGAADPHRSRGVASPPTSPAGTPRVAANAMADQVQRMLSAHVCHTVNKCATQLRARARAGTLAAPTPPPPQPSQHGCGRQAAAPPAPTTQQCRPARPAAPPNAVPPHGSRKDERQAGAVLASLLKRLPREQTSSELRSLYGDDSPLRAVAVAAAEMLANAADEIRGMLNKPHVTALRSRIAAALEDLIATRRADAARVCAAAISDAATAPEQSDVTYAQLWLPRHLRAHYVAVPTRPDGNCLFHAISLALCGAQGPNGWAARLRLLTAAWIADHIDAVARWEAGNGAWRPVDVAACFASGDDDAESRSLLPRLAALLRSLHIIFGNGRMPEETQTRALAAVLREVTFIWTPHNTSDAAAARLSACATAAALCTALSEPGNIRALMKYVPASAAPGAAAGATPPCPFVVLSRSSRSRRGAELLPWHFVGLMPVAAAAPALLGALPSQDAATMAAGLD